MDYVIDLNWNESIALLHDGDYVYIKYKNGNSSFYEWWMMKSRFDTAWKMGNPKLANVFNNNLNERLEYVLRFLFSYKIYPNYHRAAKDIVFGW